jgi:hypothetical protein
MKTTHKQRNKRTTRLTKMMMQSKKENEQKIRIQFRRTSEMILPPRKEENEEHACHAECSICYDRINNNMYVCSAPCNKIFHQKCLEKVMDQQEDDFYAAHDEDEIEAKKIKPQVRCAYCRREINTDTFILDKTLRELLQLRAGGYDVNDAIHKVVAANGSMDNGEEEFYIEYFVNVNCAYVKKPKQTFRAFATKKMTRGKIMKKRLNTARR